jgi:hypothetical protein
MSKERTVLRRTTSFSVEAAVKRSCSLSPASAGDLRSFSRSQYAERYQHTKRRLGRQRGPKVAQIELSRKLTEAIWHMLTRNQPFAPAGAPFRLAA